MEITDEHPVPVTLADQLRAIGKGLSVTFDGPSLASVRSTLTRIKQETGRDFTSRKIGGKVRVWRLS
jgi:hypothetical protein